MKFHVSPISIEQVNLCFDGLFDKFRDIEDSTKLGLFVDHVLMASMYYKITASQIIVYGMAADNFIGDADALYQEMMRLLIFTNATFGTNAITGLAPIESSKVLVDCGAEIEPYLGNIISFTLKI